MSGIIWGLPAWPWSAKKEARQAFDIALCGKGLTPSLKAMILNMKSYHHLRAGEIDQALEAASPISLSCAGPEYGPVAKRTCPFPKTGSLSKRFPCCSKLTGSFRFRRGTAKATYRSKTALTGSTWWKLSGSVLRKPADSTEAIPFLKLTGKPETGARRFRTPWSLFAQFREFFGCSGVPPKGQGRFA